VHFLQCHVYKLLDPRYAKSYDDGLVEILVEQELEGKFTKWCVGRDGISQATEA
jgi:hypothetical protein